MLLLLCAASLLPLPTAATDFACSLGRETAEVRVEIENPASGVPCNVVLVSAPDQRRRLWRAVHQPEFCPEKALEKKLKLEAAGWTCNALARAADGASATPAEDALAPDALPSALKAREAAATPAGDAVRSPDAEPAELVVVERPSSAALASTQHLPTTLEHRRCRRGAAVRHLRIDVLDAAAGTPCEVVALGVGEAAGEDQLLWRTGSDPVFCSKKLQGVLRKWSAAGWRCDGADETTVAAADEASGELRQDGAAGDPLVGDPLAGEADAAALPFERSAPDAPPYAVLQGVIAQDARRIGDWMEVEPSIAIAGHGDLDGDGLDDAVAFLAYRTGETSYRQYLMTYVVAGRTYRLAGVKLLTGVGAPPADARLEAIEAGVIRLSLPADEPGRRREIAFLLRERDLVETDPPIPAAASGN